MAFANDRWGKLSLRLQKVITWDYTVAAPVPKLDLHISQSVIEGHLLLLAIGASPRNLTFADIHTSLGHEAHPSLGLLTAEGVEVVDVRGLVCDFKVTDTAVPL